MDSAGRVLVRESSAQTRVRVSSKICFLGTNLKSRVNSKLTIPAITYILISGTSYCGTQCRPSVQEGLEKKTLVMMKIKLDESERQSICNCVQRVAKDETLCEIYNFRESRFHRNQIK